LSLDKQEKRNIDFVMEQFKDMAGYKGQGVRIREERDYMFRILNTMKQYVIVVSYGYKVEYLNRAAREVFGDITGETCYGRLGHVLPNCPVSKIIQEGCIEPLEYAVEFDGRYLKGSALSLANPDGSFSVLEVLEDITDQKQAEKKIRYLSFHDSLTEVYNRAFFEEVMYCLEGGEDYPITIIAADVDGVKLVNDTMGHSRGDVLLKACTKALKNSCGNSDILARVGGDEFALLLLRTNEVKAQQVTSRIRFNVEKHNRDYPELPLSLSLGVATAPNKEQSLLETFSKADNRMCRDKLYKGIGVRSQIISTLMVALKDRNCITEEHVQRLANLCRKMGEEIGLSPRQMGELVLLSRVHDLGKIGIPDHILFKEGPFTTEEREIMQQHSEKGYRIALSSPDLCGVADLILKHHESWDGKGYPLKLKGKEIPVECRIMSIVDAFDNMINCQSYQEKKTVEEAVAELKKYAGIRYDPELVEIFLKICH